MDLQEIFDSEPEQISEKSMKKWRKLGPLDLKKCISKNDNIFDPSLEIK